MARSRLVGVQRGARLAKTLNAKTPNPPQHTNIQPSSEIPNIHTLSQVLEDELNPDRVSGPFTI